MITAILKGKILTNLEWIVWIWYVCHTKEEKEAIVAVGVHVVLFLFFQSKLEIENKWIWEAAIFHQMKNNIA